MPVANSADVITGVPLSISNALTASRRAAEYDHADSLRREARMAEIVRQLKAARP